MPVVCLEVAPQSLEVLFLVEFLCGGQKGEVEVQYLVGQAMFEQVSDERSFVSTVTEQ
jgi:hypothetical protein